jgi:hypothetical protein
MGTSKLEGMAASIASKSPNNAIHHGWHELHHARRSNSAYKLANPSQAYTIHCNGSTNRTHCIERKQGVRSGLHCLRSVLEQEEALICE